MVKITFSISLLLTSILLVVASPAPASEIEERGHCIDYHAANNLLQIYISFFEKLDKQKANKYLAPDFSYQSASLNFLEGKNYDAVTSPNRTDFITETLQQQSNQQSSGAPVETFTVLDKIFGCKTIWFRWVDNSKPVPLYGLDEFYVEKSHGCWVITKAYSEFNNAAVLYNAGCNFTCPFS